MGLEQKPKRGLEEHSAKPQPLPTSTAQSQRGKESEAVRGGGREGRRVEAGNEALGSFAKSSSGQRRHSGTEAETSFSSFKSENCTYSSFYIINEAFSTQRCIMKAFLLQYLKRICSIHTHVFVQLWLIIPKFNVCYLQTGGRQMHLVSL